MAIKETSNSALMFEGYTLRTYTRDTHSDTDFMVEVWNPIEKNFESYMYATTRFAGGFGHAVVDATKETRKEILDFCIRNFVPKLSKTLKENWLKNYKIKLGDTVKVYKGRKVEKGTVGTIFWMKDSPYGVKIGIGNNKGVDGKYANVYWTYLKNVKPIEYQLMPSDDDFIARAIKIYTDRLGLETK